jgi:hypothetical protein
LFCKPAQGLHSKCGWRFKKNFPTLFPDWA